MAQLGGVGDHSVVGLGAADLNPLKAHLTEQAAQLLDIALCCGGSGGQDHAGPLEQIREGAAIPRLFQACHGVAAGVPQAVFQRQRSNLLHYRRFYPHQVHHLGPALHQRDGSAEVLDGGLGVEHRNQQVALGQQVVAGNTVDGAVGQGLLRHRSGTVPAPDPVVRVLFQSLRHGAALQSQARHHNQLSHSSAPLPSKRRHSWPPPCNSLGQSRSIIAFGPSGCQDGNALEDVLPWIL